MLPTATTFSIPKMRPLNAEGIRRILTWMNQSHWFPNCPSGLEDILPVINLCQSHLEVAYLLGAAIYIGDVGRKTAREKIPLQWAEGEDIPLVRTDIPYRNILIPAIQFIEPYVGWNIDETCRNQGPYGLAIAPQVNVLQYTADFLLFYGIPVEGNSFDLEWIPRYFIEVDGYQAHKNRRGKDKTRSATIEGYTGLPVIHLRETTDDWVEWFAQIVRHDWDEILGIIHPDESEELPSPVDHFLPLTPYAELLQDVAILSGETQFSEGHLAAVEEAILRVDASGVHPNMELSRWVKSDPGACSGDGCATVFQENTLYYIYANGSIKRLCLPCASRLMMTGHQAHSLPPVTGSMTHWNFQTKQKVNAIEYLDELCRVQKGG